MTKNRMLFDPWSSGNRPVLHSAHWVQSPSGKLARMFTPPRRCVICYAKYLLKIISLNQTVCKGNKNVTLSTSISYNSGKYIRIDKMLEVQITILGGECVTEPKRQHPVPLP